MEHENNIHEKDYEGSGKRDRFLPISILIAAVLIAGAVCLAAFYKPAVTVPTANPTVAGAGIPQVDTTAITKLSDRDAFLGNANAPVTIIEYGDYQCPFCGNFFSQTEPLIIANYVDTGKAKFVFRNLAFLGPESTAAANAAECAEDQNKLWAYHDALYKAKVADAARGGGEDDGFFSTTELTKLAQQVGLDISTFASCFSANKDANLVAQEKSAASTAGINSTPVFLINGQVVQGAQPYSVFQAAIDAALK
jgi:protein-disulfide isomerase